MNIYLPKSFVLLLLAIFYLVSTCALAQKKITKLTNYAGHDYWIVEKDGVKGLKSKKGELTVPVAYDLALPAIQEEFSFILKNGNLGLYDNIMQQEVVVEENQSIMNLYEGDNKKYLLVFGEKYDDYTSKKVYYVLKRNGLNIIKPVKKTYEYINADISIKNGLEKTENSKIIHQFSQIIYDEMEKISEEKSIQKTGVYSLELNKFVVKPQFLSIERSYIYNPSERVVYYDYYSASQLTPEPTKKTDHAAILYGLYSMDLQELVPPKTERTEPSSTGGYYRISSNESLLVFSKHGKLMLTLPNVNSEVISVDVVGDLFYLGFYYNDGGVNPEMRMNLKDYHIYTKDGKLLQQEKFQIDFTFDTHPVKYVTVQDPKDEWEFLVGLFNVQKAEYVLEPVYKNFRKIYYKEELIDCEQSICSYYYELKNGKNYVYINQNNEVFTPTRAISKDVFLDLYLDEFYSDYEGGIALNIKQLDSSNVIPTFSQLGNIPVTLSIYHDFIYEKEIEFYGYIKENDKAVEIIGILSPGATEKASVEYGLRYIGKKKFILPPFFSQMEFNKENNTLEFTYEGESGYILLERYE